MGRQDTRRFLRRSRGMLAAVAGVALAACGGSREAAPRPSPSAVVAVDPAVRSVGTPSGRYVGSEGCRPCHEAAARAWDTSRHRVTIRAVSPSVTPRIAGTGAHEGFDLDVSGRATGPGPDGRPIEAVAAYVVGGRHREDVWVRMGDGRLQVFPVAFDLDAGAPFLPIQARAGGALPPPGSLDFWTRVGRSADLACYGCHATGSTVTTSGTTPAGNAVPRITWSEAGVGCESCHGPGGRHVDAARENRSLAGTIERVGTADAEASIAVCASCHGLTELLASPYRSAPAHRDGVPVWSFADPAFRSPSDFEFREAFRSDLRPSSYQLEAVALGMTGCVRRGGLTCAKCHDPHSGALEPVASGPRGGDEACLPCHEASVSRAAEHTRHPAGSPGARCLACHMAPIVRGPGRSAARDHSLAPPSSDDGAPPAACAACHTEPAWNAKLRDAWRTFPRTGAAARRRAEWAEALDPKADARAAAVLRDRGAAWFVRWAVASKAAGRPRGGAPALRLALRGALADPNPAVRRAAARALGHLGSRDDAPALAERLRDPDPFVALEAAVALGISGDPAFRTRVAQVLDRPEMAGEFRAHLAVGGAGLAVRDWAVAAASLSRALELDPTLVTPWNDLGVALVGLGRADEARAAWGRALEINPSYLPAKRNIEESRKIPAPTPSPR